jgi:hypothetical protein
LVLFAVYYTFKKVRENREKENEDMKYFTLLEDNPKQSKSASSTSGNAHRVAETNRV